MIPAWCRHTIALVILFGLGIPNSVPLRAQSSGALAFDVVSPRSKIPLGQPIYLKVQLRNIGTENILVNRRFYLNDTVSLKIVGPARQELAWCGHISQVEPSPGDFVFLAPGAHIEKIVLASCNKSKTSGYTFSGPGQYVIKAQYQLPFPSEVLARAARGAKVVKGPISANPVKITLLASK